MLHLYENGVEILRNRIPKNKFDLYWNNYSLIVWEKNSSGYFDTKGIYKNNSWGIANEFPVNPKGAWTLPLKYVKYFK
jgi:hypothetical protein